MIDRTEIDAKAEELGVHTSSVQRDYVFGWLLKGIYSQGELGNRVVLKGGNCLRKAYFPFGRYSPDLDFSSDAGLPHGFVTDELNAACEFASRQCGVVFDTSRTQTRDKTNADPKLQVIESRVYFTDFYGQENWMTISIRLDITQFDRLYLPIQNRQLIHAYSDYDQCQTEIRCVKLEEQLASKMKCLLQRRHAADLFDLIATTFIAPEFAVNRQEVLTTFLRKTIFGNALGIAKGLFLDLPIDVFRGLWSKYIVCPTRSVISFDDAMASYQALIEDLFVSVATSQRQSTFFPAKLRNPIMEAGHSLTLLDLTYDDIRRTVEPYSLNYKIRKDGVGREYLYVYDRSGGHSGPGIKAMVASGVQAIANTNEKFEPRFSVDLRKAGEMDGSPYFDAQRARRTSAFGVSRTSCRRASSRSHNYVIECNVCGKRFYRTKYSTRLNQHKDKYGNRCLGKFGHQV